MKRVAVLSGVLLTGVLSLLLAQPPQQNVAEIEKVRENLFMIKGGGGNTAAFVTGQGVVVVDTKVAGWGQPILEKIKTVTDKPVTMIINTHTHGDHVGSNSEFPGTIEFVAHENCKASMEKMPLFSGEEKKKFLPSRTYKDKLSLGSGSERIDLYHFGRGHTGGDTLVVFAALRVMHSGDLFAGKQAPIIDVNNGGSGIEYPATLKKAAAGINGVESIILGHTPTTLDWSAFLEYGEFNQAFLDAVRAAHKEGKSPDEAFSSIKLPEKFKDYNMGRAKANVAALYSELKGQ